MRNRIRLQPPQRTVAKEIVETAIRRTMYDLIMAMGGRVAEELIFGADFSPVRRLRRDADDLQTLVMALGYLRRRGSYMDGVEADLNCLSAETRATFNDHFNDLNQ